MVEANNNNNTTMDLEREDTDDEFLAANLPPPSLMMVGLKFWCKVFQWPLVVLIGHVIVFLNLMDLRFFTDDYPMFSIGSSSSTGGTTDPLLNMFQTNTTILGLVLAVDTFLLYKTIRFLENDIRDYLAHRAESDTNSPHQHVHAQAVLKWEAFFHRRSFPPSSSSASSSSPDNFIVLSILTVLTIVAAACAAACIGLRIYAGTQAAAKECSWLKRAQDRHDRQQHEAKIPNLPDALQDWAYHWKNGYRGDGIIYSHPGILMGRPANFIHLTDGSTYFAGYLQDQNLPSYDVITENNESPLIAVTATGEILVYGNIASPSRFVSVQGDNQTASTMFCCTYWDLEKDFQRIQHDNGFSRILCISSNEEYDSSIGFRNVSFDVDTDERRRRRRHKLGDFVAAYDGALYYESTWYDPYSGNIRGVETRTMNLYKIDPITMAVESIANVTAFMDYASRRIMDDKHGRCYTVSQTIANSIVLLVMVPTSYIIWKQKATAAVVAPICALLFYMVTVFGNGLLPVVIWLTVLATSGSLLFRPPVWLPYQMLVWIHYSVLSLLVLAFLLDVDIPEQIFFPIIVGVMCGVLLDHPVLECFGWVIAIGSVVVSFFVWLSSGNSGYFMLEDFISVMVFGVVSGVGLTSAGGCLHRYRPYLRFYVRRLWNALDTSRNSRGRTRPADNDDSAMTAGLLRGGDHHQS